MNFLPILFQPVIIIGAGRSGTNILRDTLAQFESLGTWNCDEINYIWRHGNMHYPSDEFPPYLATFKVREFLRKKSAQLARRLKVKYIVEKTCANSLRVEFVDRVFPEAKYIYIVRDGRDVVASAIKRWKAPLDIPYILKKARYVPLSDAPYYAWCYLNNCVFRLYSHEKRLAFWGPRFDNMGTMLQTRSLAHVCAMQWIRCVERAEEAFAMISRDRVTSIKYEELVAAPVEHIASIIDFLGVGIVTDRLNAAVKQISASNIGKWKQDLSPNEQKEIEPIIHSTMNKYGYH